MKKLNYANIFLFIITTLISLLGVAFLIFKPLENKKTPTHISPITKNATYEVYLKDNPYYNQNPLNTNAYVANSIDYLNIYFDYNYGETNAHSYSYNITAEIIGYVDNINEPIWNKKFILTNPTTKNINQNKFNIKEKTTINYSYYNNLVSSYENSYNIVLDANLLISLNIEIDGKKDSIELNMPLTKTTTKIIPNYQETNSITTSKEQFNSNYLIGIILLLTSIFIIFIKKSKTSNLNYSKKILKEYKDLIIEVNNKPNITNLNILKVNNLEDLIYIAEQNNLNIIYYKTINTYNFYVIINNYVYSYELRAT